MRNRNCDLTEKRRRRMQGKPYRNRPQLKQWKLNACKAEESSTKLKDLGKSCVSRRFKRSKMPFSTQLNRDIPRSQDNESDLDCIQTQRGSEDSNYISQIERKCIVNFNSYSKLSLDSVAGLERVKQVIKECLILPAKRPDLFKGLRYPVKGVLLFGPCGSGKTLLGRCIASEMRSTFFSVSPSTLASKWMGETEKLIKALFAAAKCRQPSVIFIDNIDCILSPENQQENGSLRGIANEFIVQMDSSGASEDERVVVLGTTNKPQQLIAAALCRFEVKLQIPLLDEKGRKELLLKFLEKEDHCLEEKDIDDIARRTNNYSGSDLKLLCQEAAMAPVRCLPEREVLRIQASKLRPIIKEDFTHALSCIKASVSKKELKLLAEWNKQFGYKCSNVNTKAQSC